MLSKKKKSEKLKKNDKRKNQLKVKSFLNLCCFVTTHNYVHKIFSKKSYYFSE